MAMSHIGEKPIGEKKRQWLLITIITHIFCIFIMHFVCILI